MRLRNVAEIQTLVGRKWPNQVSDFVVVLASKEKSVPVIAAPVGGNRCMEMKLFRRESLSSLPTKEGHNV
jgi:hypothetical protein